MKINIEKDQILEALQKVQSIVEQRTTLPILSNVLLKAADGQLTLTTTNTEVSIKTNVEADIELAGETSLPAKRFFSICRTLPDHQVNIEINNGDVAEIQSGSANFKLEGLASTDFPIMPKFEGNVTYTLNQGALKSVLQKTAYAASMDESRAILNGSLLAFRDDKLTVVCTDGRRLALAEQEMEIAEDSEIDIVVPTKTITELVKSLKEDGDVQIKISDTQVAFEFGTMLIISKLVDGTYPNYRQVIPEQCEVRIEVEREVLLSAIQRVSLMIDDQAASVKVMITENRIELLTSSPEIGEGREAVPIKYSGKDITIAFNPGFMMAPLKNLDDDNVFLEFSDELSPGVIKANIPFLYVIMPIRVG